MRRWLLRLAALLSLVVGLYFLRDAEGLLPFSVHGGWTLYPPGSFDTAVRNSAVGAVLLIVAGILVALSFKRPGSKGN